MRRGNNFFRKNQYKIAAVCVVAAVLGIVGVSVGTGSSGEEVPQQVAMEETESKIVAKQEVEAETETEQTTKASAVIEPKTKAEPSTETSEPQIAGQEVAQAEPQTEAVEPEEEEKTVETSKIQQAKSAATTTELHFDTEAGLLWPVSGAVILDYSMDQTVYFTTLDQYKYNPAVIIAGNVNEKVKAAASGKITEISTNEVTGCTVTMDIGDGYSAIYGQLKEVPYEVGAHVEAGNTLGFVNEPTKYYALEGSNVYFSLEKDGTPVDPVEYFQ